MSTIDADVSLVQNATQPMSSMRFSRGAGLALAAVASAALWDGVVALIAFIF